MSDYGETDVSWGSPDYEKDPDSTEDYTFNWTGHLGADTISTSEFLLPDGLTQVSVSNTDTQATIMVSGGTRGRMYRIVNRVTSSGGRQWDQTIRVIIREQ